MSIFILIVVAIVVVFIILYFKPSEREKTSRIVALLNLSGSYTAEDRRALNVVEGIDVVDIGSGDIIGILSRQYEIGKRIFIGPSTSTGLTIAKPWFDAHPDTYSISLTSTAPSLSSNDNIIRLTPPDSQVVYVYVDLASKAVGGCSIIVQKGDVASQELGVLIDEECKRRSIKSSYRTIDLDTDSVVEILRGVGENTLLMPFFLSQREKFWSSYVESKSKSPLIESVGSNPPNVQPRAPFNGKYMFISSYPRETSTLRRLREKFGEEISTNMYDAITIAKKIDEAAGTSSMSDIITSISDIPGVTGYLDLDKNGDRMYTDYLVYILEEDLWKPILLYGNDLKLGKFLSELS